MKITATIDLGAMLTDEYDTTVEEIVRRAFENAVREKVEAMVRNDSRLKTLLQSAFARGFERLEQDNKTKGAKE